MSRSDREPLLGMLSALGPLPARLSTEPLTLFAARAGEAQTGELMMVGRAPNGGDSSFALTELANAARRAELVTAAIDEAAPSDWDPQGWIHDQWGAVEGYNTRKSQFWRVVRAVSLRVVPESTDDTWASVTIWTNLYKISPHATGNPPASLCKAQRAGCSKVLSAEITMWRPKRIVMLTGMSWAQHFLADLGCNLRPAPQGSPIEAVGTTVDGARLAVAPHPQGRPEQPIIDAICDAVRI